MTSKTVTRVDLANAVCRRVGLSHTESAALVELVLDEICNSLVKGEAVKLSSFATFQVRNKSERVGRNPKTGVEALIPPRRVVTFKAANVLKQRIVDSHRAKQK
ncbi:integration host factor subunit alpha [Bartonella sp. F02]|uniref:integration host factor subunit alpha n=1 Tax=Bartonella sp. F02 TaxID=2967262 RepID=UPI0022A9A84F|nr:integration host factor subunit alpha [Bartonella sp. F02]MCZ2328313.1 integration host factor subunit alpha [Bartonella sp. F02]